jgi:uncharacterized protein Yka (UPF0111/DUF47 family)
MRQGTQPIAISDEFRYTIVTRRSPMLKRLIPQEYNFFESFDQAANHTVSAARLLLKLTEHYDDADPIARELNGIEHACDDVTHRTMDQLNKSFITPLDREDIHMMILRIDDVVDLTNAAANRLAFFNIQKPTQHSVNLAKQVVRGCEKLAEAVHGMRSAKNYERVMQDCITVHEVENAADDILHSALAELFATEKNAIEVIKWKDIYETMERITDKLEDVANVLQGVIVKMS